MKWGGTRVSKELPARNEQNWTNWWHRRVGRGLVGRMQLERKLLLVPYLESQGQQ